MADKNTNLAITISTVDKATAKIKAINAQLDAITKPTRDFKKALGELGEKSGLDNVMSGFKGVGSAIGDLLGKVAMIGGVAGLAGAALFKLVDEFDELGDKAERFGVSVDFLAQMRYAAEKAGAPVEALDDGLQSFSVNLGKLSANTGRMKKFLDITLPSLEKQLKAAKSNEEAFYLLASAMDKIKDPAKRAALAAAAGLGPELAPLLAKGVDGVKALGAEFKHFAGDSMQDAADKAGAVDDSLHNLHASTQGVKAAILSGLAPALKVLVDQLAEWFVAHREDVKLWAAQIGQKLPAAVNAVVDAIKAAVKWVADIIDKIGGLKNAAILAAAVVAGPLLSAVASLGLALLTTIGRVAQLAKGIGALPSAIPTATSVAGGAAAAGEGSALSTGAKAVGGGILSTVALPFAAGIAITHYGNKYIGHESTASKIARIQLKGADDPEQAAYLKKQVDSNYDSDYVEGPSPYDLMQHAMDKYGGQANRAAPEPQTATVLVKFENALRGMRATVDPQSTADVSIESGHNFGYAQ